MEIILPKPYLSHSQMQLWKSSKEQYRQKYYLNGPSFENKEMIFGRRIAKMLEDGVDDPVLNRVPKYPFMEHRIELPVLGVPFLGVMDSFSKHRKAFREYKTGKGEWTKAKCKRHEQLVIYSLLTKLKYGKVTSQCELVWIETRDCIVTREFDGHILTGKNNTIEFTGKIKRFKRKITQKERDAMARKIRKVAEEISEDFKQFKYEQERNSNISRVPGPSLSQEEPA